MINKHKYTYDEAEKIVVQTKHFINQHLYNYNDAIKRIICHLDVEDNFIHNFRTFKNCNFDNYLNQHLKKANSTNDFTELVDAHTNFHLLIGEVLTQYKINKQIPESLFNSLISNHNSCISQLNEILNTFEYVLHQVDKLTNTWHRDMFIELLKSEYEKSRRIETNFCLAFFDIDNFKSINDLYGHDCGDFVLKELISVAKINLREYDTIGRWGGEEFLTLLPEAKLDNAYEIINRVKEAIEKHIFIYGNLELHITCSFGITQSTKNLDYEDMITVADALMYKAKKNGKNCIEI